MATLVNEINEAGRTREAQYTITATATALSSSGILNSSQRIRVLTVKNADGAANACYLGKQDVDNSPTAAGVELGAGDSITYMDVIPSQLYIVGTANAANIAHITAQY